MCLLLLCSCAQSRLRWVVYYGPPPDPQFFKNMDLAIVEPDLISPDRQAKTVWYAYLSIGEIHKSRPYFSLLEEKGVLADTNSNWPGAYTVDVRSPVWKEMILKTLIPSFLAQGYTGIFLDTIDVPIFLEPRLPGSRQALINLIREIHAQYPRLHIIPNNGLDILPEIQGIIDGIVVEDLYTHYDFITKKSIATQNDISESKEVILDAFIKKTGKPVMTLLYDHHEKSDLVKQSIQRAEHKKYQWYWSPPGLGSSID